MPPAGCLWCLNPFLCVLLFIPVYAIPALFSIAGHLEGITAVFAYIFILVGAAGFARLTVAGLVRFSIWHGQHIATGLIQKSRPDVVIGFSWGGMVGVGVRVKV